MPQNIGEACRLEASKESKRLDENRFEEQHMAISTEKWPVRASDSLRNVLEDREKVNVLVIEASDLETAS